MLAQAYDLGGVIAVLSKNDFGLLPPEHRADAAAIWGKLADCFAKDIACAYSDVTGLAAPLEPQDSAQATRNMGELYLKWRDEGAEAPSMAALVAIMMHGLGIQGDSALAHTVLAAALLAEIPNDKPFHGNAHYRDILCSTFRLLTLHRHRASIDKDLYDLPPETAALMLVAACVHDYCHDGRGNNIDGVHTPMRLEKNAFDKAEPSLRQFGLPQSELERVRVMILTTDVSFDDMGSSPSRRLRAAYAHHFEGKHAPKLCPVLVPLAEDKTLSLMAMMLEEADIYTSVGLNYDYARLTTVLVAQETKILTTKASTLHGFIEMICGGLMASPASRLLFNETFQAISRQAAEDVRANIDYARATPA